MISSVEKSQVEVESIKQSEDTVKLHIGKSKKKKEKQRGGRMTNKMSPNSFFLNGVRSHRDTA